MKIGVVCCQYSSGCLIHFILAIFFFNQTEVLYKALVHYANVPCLNKQCVLSGDISKYLTSNINFASSETSITHKKIRLKKWDTTELYYTYS